MPRALLTAALVAAFSCVPIGAPAEAARCMARKTLLPTLEKRQEVQVGIGLASNGSLVEVFSTADGSKWSIVMTDP